MRLAGASEAIKEGVGGQAPPDLITLPDPKERARLIASEEQIRAELGSLFDIVQLREFRFDQVEAVGTRFLGWSCLLRRREADAQQ